MTGIDFDGGYAEYLIAWEETPGAIPEELPAEEPGPFICAGVTVFNALLPFMQSVKFDFLMNIF